MLKLTVLGGLDQTFISKLKPLIAAEIETALDKSAAAILNQLRTTYLAEQDPNGTPWIPSKAGIKRRKKGGTGTLFDTGRLYRSIQLTKSEPGLRVIGTDVPYGKQLQDGTDLSGIPRPFLDVTPQATMMAVKTFEFQINKMLKGVNV